MSLRNALRASVKMWRSSNFHPTRAGSSSSTDGHVSVSANSSIPGVKLVSMDRAPVNGLDEKHMNNISQTIGAIAKDPESKGIILTSSLSGLFCAGLDIEYMLNIGEDEAKWQGMSEALATLWSTIYGCPLPVVTAINGHAIAGGCLITSASDYRIMVRNGTIGLPETKLDIVSPLYLIETMASLVGRAQAERIFIWGEVFPAERGKELGLVDEVVDSHEEMQERALQLMQELLAIPESSEHARRETKLMFRRPLLQMIAARKDEVIRNFVEQARQPNAQANMKAYFASVKKRSSKL